MSGSLFQLRPLQEQAMGMLRDSLRSGKRHPVIQAPTGFGKVVLGAHIVTGARAKKNRVAFVVPALSLIDQTYDRFRENGVDASDMGVLQGNHPLHRPNAPIQICSSDTIASRGYPDVDFVVIDECHIQRTVVTTWLKENPKKVFVGLSATPWSRGMAYSWDDLLIPATTSQLIERGDLCKFEVFGPKYHPALDDVDKGVGGDWAPGQLSAKMRETTLVADVVDTWVNKAEWRPTLLFAVDRTHAAALHDAFDRACVHSTYVDQETTREERAEISRKFQNKEIEVICSVGTMTTGVDLDVRCIVLARPTKSHIRFVQMIGRGLRNAPGKDKLIILDHTDTHLQLGMVTDIYFDRLRGGKPTAAEVEREAQLAPSKPFQCQQCTYLLSFSVFKCPKCGCERKRPVKPSSVVVHEGELVQLQSKRQAKENRSYSMSEKAHFYGELKTFCAAKGYKSGWAANKYREKFGVWPNDPQVRHAAYQEPSMETRSWIKGMQIRRVKSTEKAAS